MHTRGVRQSMDPMRLTGAAALLVLIAVGCAPLGFLASGFEKDTKKVQREAQYPGLVDGNVAVMVVADEYTLFHFPEAPLSVCRAVSARLADNIDSLTVMDPQLVMDYQADNPYWHAVPYNELIDNLHVDAIVLIDLIEYRTHEPGNAHVWQGVITGNVGVIEKHTADPDNFVFYTTVTANFPEDNPVGLLDSDDQTVQLGMLSLFSRDAGGLFYDHEVTVKKK